MDVLLFVQIKILFATTILALRLFEVLLFGYRWPCDSPAIETGSESHGTDSDYRRSCRKKDGRYSMFEAEILNTFWYKKRYLMLTFLVLNGF